MKEIKQQTTNTVQTQVKRRNLVNKSNALFKIEKSVVSKIMNWQHEGDYAPSSLLSSTNTKNYMSKITENFIRRAWGFAKRGKDILKFPHMVTESNIHVKTVVSFSICYYETNTFFIHLLFQKYNFTLLIIIIIAIINIIITTINIIAVIITNGIIIIIICSAPPWPNLSRRSSSPQSPAGEGGRRAVDTNRHRDE